MLGQMAYPRLICSIIKNVKSHDITAIHKNSVASLHGTISGQSSGKELSDETYYSLDVLRTLSEKTFSKKFEALSSIYNSSRTSLRLPTVNKIQRIEDPVIKHVFKYDPLLSTILEKFDPLPFVIIKEPSKEIAKEAARLIVIRRRKMRKHKLKKLRKKMKFLWAKRRQKREYAKELLFQSEQMAKLRKAEAFDAVKYVRDKLAELNEVPIPRTWKGKPLSQRVIKNLMIDPLYYNTFKHPSARKKKTE